MGFVGEFGVAEEEDAVLWGEVLVCVSFCDTRAFRGGRRDRLYRDMIIQGLE